MPSEWQKVDDYVHRFEIAWRDGQRPAIDDFLPQQGPIRLAVLKELIQVDIERRRQDGDPARPEEYRERYPELTAFTDQTQAHQFPLKEHVLEDGPIVNPQQIGRYRVDKILGEGGFGLVYLAHDDQLQRLVAIKVPHNRLVAQGTDAQAYLTEARTVANLDHPNIVPVHDVGGTDQFPCYVVSKYIDGTDLAKSLKQSRLSLHEAAELVATVADALHHAHKQGLVHRDIKPGNILLDGNGKPFVADFGLALREKDVGKGPRYAGTPAYMSPEQARGEGHRVDGRSDIFSLGVVFYELLTGRRPFKGDSQAELIDQITNVEARPPRQWDDHIPKELDRICLKALSKRASERYSAAKDMADDLRHFLAEASVEEKSILGGRPRNDAEIATPVPTPATPPTGDCLPLKIVPKGLRSFDAHDANFFLELLPGPRDRDGLPNSIRFWKTRIEETDADNTFSVGIICGPSGCGKSSLVKAGLLPRLADNVIAVYVEATGDDTEARLLKGLRKRCPSLPGNLGLKETLAALRRGQGILPGKKVVIILDQFEQWLHAKKEEESSDLVQALRQCDGGRVQCVVMVRDDFWMAAIRFMRELDIRQVEGQNFAAVDLFDLDHARKVLAAFGRAFGKLPESSAETTKDQKEFLKQAIQGLAQENKVICVRLALFAEMMKGRLWTPSSLKEVGGTEGVGVTFLEETFSAATAPPEHRYHQKAARRVLKALLPESGSNIKGHLRSYGDLLEASGYTGRAKDFHDLVRILDSEVRLITPTDPEGEPDDEREAAVDVAAGGIKYGKPGGVSPRSPPPRYYQLTHDYLVHSLRDWLTRKQKETRRGRAELLLADRAAVWNARPENRQLPSLVQWFQIKWLTAKKNWTLPQRKMMIKTGRFFAVRLFLLASVVTLSGWGLFESLMYFNAVNFVTVIKSADTSQLPQFLPLSELLERRTTPLLRQLYEESPPDSKERLHASLALSSVGPSQIDFLYGRLLKAAPHEVSVIRDALFPHKDKLLDKLWAVVESPAKGKEKQRLRAASALAKYDPDSERWDKTSKAVVEDFITENPVFLALWMEGFRPIKEKLLPPLESIYRGTNGGETERFLATTILTDYASDNPQVLANLVMDADEKQFASIFLKFKDCGAQVRPMLTIEIDKKLPSELPSSDDKREKLAKRQANAAVALLRINQPDKVWPLLKHSPDPRVRSYLIHRLGPLGADAKAIVKQLEGEKEIAIRRALLLILGEFGEQDFTPEERKAMLPKLQDMYRTDADPGLHAAAESVLRTWKQEVWLKQVNDDWAKDKEQQKKRLESIERLVTKDKEKTPPQWYVNSQEQTMVVIPGPVEFVMGSPASEVGRYDNETQLKRRIGRTFAVAAKPVTVEQYRKFDARHGIGYIERWALTADSPVIATNWYEAVAYCNWLSKQEGLPESEWCYEPLQDPRAMPALAGSIVGLLDGSLGSLAATCGLFPGRTDPEYKEGMKLAGNYLQRKGYRLPTEAEMEYVARAGAVTARYYGETEELLEKYSLYQKNSQVRTWPVGCKKPNDTGLFDVQGNVYTWCQERFSDYPQIKSNEINEDEEDVLVVRSIDSRALRGGSFIYAASNVRSAYRLNNVPTNRLGGIGIRPARTLPLGSFTGLPPSPEGGRK